MVLHVDKVLAEVLARWCGWRGERKADGWMRDRFPDSGSGVDAELDRLAADRVVVCLLGRGSAC